MTSIRPAAHPGERLVGDITYLKTGEGWLYLATVIDLATRMVVGWQLAEHMRTSLVVDAVQMGIAELAELGVARVSYAFFLHHAAMEHFSNTLASLV